MVRRIFIGLQLRRFSPQRRGSSVTWGKLAACQSRMNILPHEIHHVVGVTLAELCNQAFYARRGTNITELY